MTRKRERYEKAVAAKGRELVGTGLRNAVKREDAEDLAQDVVLFALCYEEWETVKDVGAFLYQVWKNKDGNRRKQASIRINALENAIIKGLIEVGEATESAAEAFSDVAEKFGEIMEASTRADLTRRQDYVFLARANGREYEEIAKQLGITAGNARATYSVACDKIRVAMGIVENEKGSEK